MSSENLVDDAMAELQEKQDKLSATFLSKKYERFDVDIAKRTFWWSDNGVPKVRADVTVVGSYSENSKSWLWAWANPGFDGVDIGEIDKVREIGEEYEIDELSEAKMEYDEDPGWTLTALAAKFLEAQGAYRCPTKSGGLYLLLDNMRYEK